MLFPLSFPFMSRTRNWQRNPVAPIPTVDDIAAVASEWCGEPLKWADVMTVRTLMSGHRFGNELPGPVGVAYRALRQCCARPGARGRRAAILIGHDHFLLFDMPPHGPAKTFMKEIVNLLREGSIPKMRAKAEELRQMLDEDPLGQYPPHAQGRGFFD